MNDPINGIGISDTRHAGSHFNYNQAVRDRLLKIQELYPGNSLTPEIAAQKLEYLSEQIKLILNQNPSLAVNDQVIADLIKVIPIN